MIWVLLILIGALCYMWFQHPHIVTSLKMAFRSGRFGPAINEMEQFANRSIPAVSPDPWPTHAAYQAAQLADSTLLKLEALETTALVVIKDEKILFERYWSPFEADTPTNSFSVAKSVVNVLCGIAMQDGLLQLDEPVYKYLPSFALSGKKVITLRHLLSMSSGLSWTESQGGAFSDNAVAYYGTDLKAIVEGLTLKKSPGKMYRYASGNTQIIAMVLEVVTGMNISEYAAKRLWGVIGAEYDAHWNLDKPGGMEKAFCCLYAAPRDFARIGQLYLNGGVWAGKQVVASSFVAESLKAMPIHDIWTNRTNTNYGLHWWLVKHKDLDFFYARGIRGQYILCNQALSLVIVRMGHRRNPVERHSGHPPDLFDHINAGMEIITSCPH